jgi:DNA-binding GntR family transcriptional regulator
MLTENVSLYFKVYLKIKHSIISGEFKKGDKIGTIWDLSSMYGVAPETLRRALRLLEMEGLLRRKKGVETIIPESANLTPLELSKLVTVKNVVATFSESKIVIYSAEWVPPNRRLTQLYDLGGKTPDSKIYKIFYKCEYKSGITGIINHYVSEHMYRGLELEESPKPYDVILKLAEWADRNSFKLDELLQPYLCMNENAELLGVPDGTPVFYQEFIAWDKKGWCLFSDLISNANISRHTTDYTEGTSCH